MSSDINVIIVEDVESYLVTIEKLMLEVAPHTKVVGKSTTLGEAERLIRLLKPDVVLLDIQFELEGKTAFDMLNDLAATNDLNFKLIFITAHQEAKYYAQAFQYNALHFIEKPIDKEKLKTALQRAEGNGGVVTLPLIEQFGALHKKIHGTEPASRIVIEGNLFSELITVEDIATIEASGRYSTILLSNGRKVVSCKNLGEYEKMLIPYGFFVRIHKNRIINYSLVRRYCKKERLIELIDPLGKYFASKDRFRDFLALSGQNGVGTC